MKRIIVFYSYSGNTKDIAYKIREKYNYDLVEIKTVEDYSEDYEAVLASEEKLVPLDYQPDIEKIDVDFSKYDEIILCTPVWWYSVASPVNTFLHTYDLKNKPLIVVATNGGWIGRTFDNIAKLTESEIKNTISLTYEDGRLTSTYEFEDWLNNLEEDNNK